jgi:hypothetical protein
MNGLPAWKLDRVTEHIEAHLADTIKVHELAELSEPERVNDSNTSGIGI